MRLTPLESFVIVIAVYLVMQYAVFEYTRKKHIKYWKAKEPPQERGE